VAFLNLYRWRVPTVSPVGAGISFDLYLRSFPTSHVPSSLTWAICASVLLAEGLERLDELLVELGEVALFDDRPLRAGRVSA